VLLVVSSLHLIFIIVFDKVTAFAPDELNYIGIFNNLYRSDFSLDGYLGWQEGSINVLRLIYFPAKLLLVVGCSDFYAVRILSIFYSMISLYLLLKIAPEERFLRRPKRFWLVSAYFIPSVFLWSSLGLRESFILFSLIAIFYLLVNPQNLKFKVQFLLLVATSSFFLISKIYLYGLLLLCLTTSVLILIFLKQNLEISKIKILTAILVPLLLFPSMAINIVGGARGTLEVKLSPPTPTSTPTPTPTSTSTPTSTPTSTIPARGQTLHDLNQQLNKNAILSWLSTVTGLQSALYKRAKDSYLPAGSLELYENTTQLQTRPATLRDPLSILAGAYDFLFVPMPFVDNGSFFLNAQSYESFAWYLFYLIFILLLMGLLRGRFILNLVTVSTTIFALGFIVLSALIEINDGTSVRHRVVLLIAILIMLVTFRLKNDKPIVSQ